MNNKGISSIAVVLIVVGILAVVGGGYYLLTRSSGRDVVNNNGVPVDTNNNNVQPIAGNNGAAVPPDTQSGKGGSPDVVTEMAYQTRDGKRVDDVLALKSAITLYLLDNKLSGCTAGKVYKSTEGTTAVDGSGWLPVNFKKVPADMGGSPLMTLPVDPVNDATHYFSYACNSAKSTFELNARLESAAFSRGASTDQVSTDGGNNPDVYEAGYDLQLIK